MVLADINEHAVSKAADELASAIVVQLNYITRLCYQSGMPKIVDARQRRQDIAEAAWRVIRRDGLESVTVRTVATEAGLSMGSLRHYFTTQSELVGCAMRLVVDRLTARLEALESTGDPRTDLEHVVTELLPLDDERRTESEVWLSFSGKALIDPALHRLSDEVYDSLHELMLRLLTEMAEGGDLPNGREVDVEAERLQALIDGLLVHGITRPVRVSPERIRTVVSGHLDSLTPRQADADAALRPGVGTSRGRRLHPTSPDQAADHPNPARS